MELLHSTIGDSLSLRARQSPDKLALVYRDQSYTWSEIDRITDYLAVRMDHQGIRKGTHVGIWSVNTPNWILTFLALEKLGAIPALINTCYKMEELRNIIQYADLEYLCYGDGYKTLRYEPMIQVLQQEDWSRGISWIPIGRDQSGQWMTERDFVEEASESGTPVRLAELRSQVRSEDTAAMLFTSGTTSAAKGVLLSHDNLINSARGTLEFTRWTEEDRFLVAVPMFHCFGITSNLLAGIQIGCTIYLMKYFKSVQVMQEVDKHQITVLSGVPSMFLAIVHKPERTEYSQKSLRSGIIAGSAVSEQEYHLIQREIPEITLLPSYGQTETSPCVTLMLQEDPVEKRASTAGRLISGVEVRFVNPADGKLAAAGQTGEIQVRGYNVMQGYYKMPEATRETLLTDGWLRTGDLGFLDEAGYLHVVGRIKEMIVRAGENISPHEIEACLLDLPYVQEAKVLGIPAEVVQEKIIACVIPKPGTLLKENEILLYLTGRLAHYKVPSHILEFQEFPVTASGKVMISELKQQVIERLSKM